MSYDVEINDAMNYDIYPLVNMATWSPQHVRHLNEAQWLNGLLWKDDIVPYSGLSVQIAQWRAYLDYVLVTNKTELPTVAIDPADRGLQVYVWVQYEHLDPVVYPTYGYTIANISQEVFEAANPLAAILCLIDVPIAGDINSSHIFNNVETKASNTAMTLLIERPTEQGAYNARMNHLGNGRVLGFLNDFEVTAGAGLSLNFRSGGAFLDAKYFLNLNDSLAFSFTDPAATLSRVDLYVLDNTKNLGFIKQVLGTPALPALAGPPALPAGTYPICTYTVDAGDTVVDVNKIQNLMVDLISLDKGPNQNQVGSEDIFHEDTYRSMADSSADKILSELAQITMSSKLPSFLNLSGVTSIQTLPGSTAEERVAPILKYETLILPYVDSITLPVDHAILVSLINDYIARSPYGKIYGHVPQSALTPTETLEYASYWKALGVHGLVFSSSGWDTITRTEQIALKAISAQVGLLTMWEAVDPRDIFSDTINDVYETSGTGVIVINTLRRPYTLAQTPNSLRVFVDGTEYAEGTGLGTYTELSSTSFSINTALTAPTVETYNRAGNDTTPGNLNEDASPASSEDSYLFKHWVLDSSLYSPPNYGWDAAADIIYWGDVIESQKMQYYFSALVEASVDYVSLAAITPPTLPAAGTPEYYHRNYKSAPDYGTEFMFKQLDAAYMYAVMYGINFFGFTVLDPADNVAIPAMAFTPPVLPYGWFMGNTTSDYTVSNPYGSVSRVSRGSGKGLLTIDYDESYPSAVPVLHSFLSEKRILARDVFFTDNDDNAEESNLEELNLFLTDKINSLFNIWIEGYSGLKMEVWNGATWEDAPSDYRYVGEILDSRIRFSINVDTNLEIVSDAIRVDVSSLAGSGLVPDPAGTTYLLACNWSTSAPAATVNGSSVIGTAQTVSRSDHAHKLTPHFHNSADSGGASLHPANVRFSDEDAGQMSYFSDVESGPVFQSTDGPGVALQGDFIARRGLSSVYNADFADAVALPAACTKDPGTLITVDQHGFRPTAKRGETALGIISDTAAFIAGSGKGRTPLGLAGQIFLKVAKNHSLRPGDKLVSAPDGVAVKKTILDSILFRPTVAIVLETFDHNQEYVDFGQGKNIKRVPVLYKDSCRVLCWIKEL